jgi:twitching motility protein PilT
LLNASDLSFDLLRLPPILKSFVTKPHGLILLLGSTGAGKTTTRAAITEYINTTFRKHVIILEDIREFEHQSRLSLISQYSIPAETDLKSYRTTMISALRENPDIVMFGDMRNPELISLALNMAATGHLVVAELHAGNVQHALYRIAGNASARQQRHIREQLAELLIGAVAQRLIKKGTNEAVPVAEILINTDATRSLIRSGKFSAIPDIMRMSRDIGMILFEDALSKLT